MATASFINSGSVEKAHQRQDTVLQVRFCYPEVLAWVGGRRCEKYPYNYSNDAQASLKCLQ